MNPKITIFICVAFLSLVVAGFVLLYFPVSVLRYLPIYDCHFVYKYYLVDENGDIQDASYRSAEVSQSDTEKLFEELIGQRWSTKISNDWKNHKLVFTTILGIKFSVNIQSLTSDRAQINGSGAWLDSESAIRLWAILNRYIVDDHVANGP